MDKPFRTYEELLQKLKEKKMTISDPERVVYLLKQHSYFSLVSGYKDLFKQKNGEYLPGTTIDDLFALFSFDDQLRGLFFRAIQDVEKHMKSLLSQAFVEKYGDHQDNYLDYQNYRFIGTTDQETYRRCNDVRKLIQTFQKKVHAPFEQKYIAHQWERHRNVPLWVTIKAVTLGTASKMYSLCTQDVQAAISKEFPCVTEGNLVGMLDFLTNVRNVCAHNERLYCFSAEKRRAIQDMPLHHQLGIGKKKGYYRKGKQDLFAAMICLKYLLSNEMFFVLTQEIDEALNCLCDQTKLIKREQLLSQMGFPTNWKESVSL